MLRSGSQLLRALWFGMLLTAGEAMADRALPGRWQRHSVDAVFLGTWSDFEGNKASYFWAPSRSRSLGPLEHRSRPAVKLPFRASPPPRSSPGTRGELVFWARGDGEEPAEGPLDDDLEETPPAEDRFFSGFSARGPSDPSARRSALLEALPKLTDPFLLGLLAGESELASEAAAKLSMSALAQSEQRPRWAPAAQGILYAASRSRATELLEGQGLYDLWATPPPLLIRLIHDPLPRLATPTPPEGAPDWQGWVPTLAHLYLTQPRQFSARAEEALFGSSVEVPFDLSKEPPNPFRSPRPGLFLGPGEGAGPQTLFGLVKRKDARFAAALLEILNGLQAASTAVVVDTFTGGVVAFSDGRFLAVRLPKGARLPEPGSALRFLAREEDAGQPLVEGARLRWHDPELVRAKKWAPATAGASELVPSLQAQVHSGGIPYSVGRALAVLEAIAREGRAPGFDEAAFWRHLLTLPGNPAYEFGRTASEWSQHLGVALKSSRSKALAVEMLKRLPELMKALTGKTGKASGDGFRRFMLEAGIPGALACLSAEELECAARYVDAIEGPVERWFPKGTHLAAETDQRYFASRIRPIAALVARLRGGSVPKPTPEQARFELELFRGFAEPFGPELASRWQQELHAAGY